MCAAARTMELSRYHWHNRLEDIQRLPASDELGCRVIISFWGGIIIKCFSLLSENNLKTMPQTKAMLWHHIVLLLVLEVGTRLVSYKLI